MIKSPGPVLADLGSIFNLGISVPIRWYGLLTGLAFLLVFSVAIYALKYRESLEKRNIQDYNILLDWACVSFLAGIMGARLWFVILEHNYFFKHPQEILAIWQGGQSIQGGIIGGLLGAFIFYFINKKNLVSWCSACDSVLLAMPLGQALGRLGNFFNTEAFGPPCFHKFCLFVPLELRPIEYSEYQTFHPIFLYEAVFMLLIFLLLLFVFLKAYSPSLISCFYLIAYSVLRFFLEDYRTDSLYIFNMKAAQFICVLTCLLVFLYLTANYIYINKKTRAERQNNK